MFLRKLLKLENKLSWIFIDLIIVIIGVYCAFLIQNYSAQKQNEKEKEKVLTALKYELEAFRIQLPEYADYMMKYADELKDQTEVNFSGWRYIEPQYAYQIVEYSIKLENNEIIDFDLYDKLQQLYVRIKQLEHVERLITHYSGLYKRSIRDLDAIHPSNLERKADNASNYFYFLMYVKSRPSNLNGVAAVSKDALLIIDEQLGYEKTKAIEFDFLLSNMQRVNSEQEAVQIGSEFFPKFSEEEIRSMYLDFRKKSPNE